MLTPEKYKELTKNEFAKAAKLYDTDKAGVYKICRDDYEGLLKNIEKEPFTTLLDASCGTAPMLELISQDMPEAKLTGLDLSPEMIAVAQQKQIPNTNFIVGDCEELPFDDETFDIVISCESFHHYPNPQAFFNSAAKVLVPGGRLIVHDYGAEGAIKWAVNHIEMPLCHLFGHGDVAVRSEQEYRTFARNAGLETEEYRKMGGFYKIMATFRKPMQ